MVLAREASGNHSKLYCINSNGHNCLLLGGNYCERQKMAPGPIFVVSDGPIVIEALPFVKQLDTVQQKTHVIDGGIIKFENGSKHY